MHFHVINNYRDFLSLEGIWNRLLEASGSDHIHCTFEWLSTWWRHFGGDKELFIIVAKEGDETIGIAPLMIHKVGKFYKGFMKFMTVSFIGYGFADAADFLITKNRGQVLKEFFAYIYENDKLWDELRLFQLSDTSPNFNIIKEKISKNKYDSEMTVLIGCPYLEIEGDFEDYFNKLDRKLRYNIRSRNKKIKKENINLKFELIDKIDERVLKSLQKLNRRRFKLTKRMSRPFLIAENFSFLNDISTIFNKKRWWRIFSFTLNDEIVSYRLCFDYNNTIYDWNVSHDVDYNKYGIGTILLKPILEYCFEKKYNFFDFMAGDEDYKFKWTKSYRNNYQIIMKKRTFKAKFKTKISLAYERIRDNIKKN